MSEKVFLLPSRLSGAVSYARRCHPKSPAKVIEHVLEQGDSYVTNWMNEKDNMKKIVEIVYSNAEFKETLDFLPFEEMMERFMKGQAFGVYEEAETVPFKILQYDEKTRDIYELYEDKDGKYYMNGLRNPINNDEIRFKRKHTAENPFDYATKADVFFNFHFVYEYGGK